MKHFIFAVCLCLMAGFSAFAQETDQDTDVAPEAEIAPPFAILEIKIKSAEWTEYYPECGEDCVPWSYWNRYTAKVEQVLHGDYDQKTIKFVLLQHAGYANIKNRKAYIVVEKFTNAKTVEQLETPYFVDKIRFPVEMVCFHPDTMKAVEDDSQFEDWDAYVMDGPDGRCFDRRDLVLDEDED